MVSVGLKNKLWWPTATPSSESEHFFLSDSVSVVEGTLRMDKPIIIHCKKAQLVTYWLNLSTALKDLLSKNVPKRTTIFKHVLICFGDFNIEWNAVREWSSKRKKTFCLQSWKISPSEYWHY